MTDASRFTITLEQEAEFDFRVKFDWPGNAVHEHGEAALA